MIAFTVVQFRSVLFGQREFAVLVLPYLRARFCHHSGRDEVERVQDARPHYPLREAFVRLRQDFGVVHVSAVAVRCYIVGTEEEAPCMVSGRGWDWT